MTRARSTRAASLSTIVRRAIEGEGECALAKGTTVVVAVSGGPDSMALLSVLARVGPRAGLSIVAHGVDHGLRPGAAAELDLAEEFARGADVPFDRTRVSVARGGNLQARARELRWHALASVARRHGAAIAAAHHAGDRAETMLMRLLRGAGLRGLAVLPPKTTAPGADDVLLVRPLLRAQRSDIDMHLGRHAVPFATDPSNEDPRYLRTRVRQHVIPLLEQLDPAVVRHIEALADELVTTLKAASTGRPTRPTRGNAPDESGAPAWTAALPRATQEALAAMLRSRSREARVWLPGGLVVSVDPKNRHPVRGPSQRIEET